MWPTGLGNCAGNQEGVRDEPGGPGRCELSQIVPGKCRPPLAHRRPAHIGTTGREHTVSTPSSGQASPCTMAPRNHRNTTRMATSDPREGEAGARGIPEDSPTTPS